MLPDFLKTRLDSFLERRRGERIVDTSIVAYYWNGSVPLPHRGRDSSRTGFTFIQRSGGIQGTMPQLTLDFKTGTAISPAGAVSVESTRVWSKVVRFEADRVGFDFMLLKAAERKKMADLTEKAIGDGGNNNAQSDK